jgi:hypothetical protein
MLQFKDPPFDQLKNIQRLSSRRRDHGSIEHARHHLYIGRDNQTSTSVFVNPKPGEGTYTPPQP